MTTVTPASRETTAPPLTCSAHIGHKAGEFGFEFVICRQTVGVRGYWTQPAPTNYSGGHFVTYCAIEGHEAQVRRRYAEVDPPEPKWLHEDPAFAPESSDLITAAKWEAARHGR